MYACTIHTHIHMYICTYILMYVCAYSANAMYIQTVSAPTLAGPVTSATQSYNHFYPTVYPNPTQPNPTQSNPWVLGGVDISGQQSDTRKSCTQHFLNSKRGLLCWHANATILSERCAFVSRDCCSWFYLQVRKYIYPDNGKVQYYSSFRGLTILIHHHLARSMSRFSAFRRMRHFPTLPTFLNIHHILRVHARVSRHPIWVSCPFLRWYFARRANASALYETWMERMQKLATAYA